MGDVALTAPVIKEAVHANNDLNITVVTREFFIPFFSNTPNIAVYTPLLKGRHKGFWGMVKLFFDIKKTGNYSTVIDLHNVLRTKILGVLFRISGVRVYRIKKSRKEKKAHLKIKDAPRLKHSLQRYIDVFENAGIKTGINENPFTISNYAEHGAMAYLREHKLEVPVLVGLAPFAKHPLKVWPEQKLEELLTLIQSLSDCRVLLFGGGNDETDRLNLLAQRFPFCHTVNTNLEFELALIRNLSLMISMDSSNMHIAALSGVPVISIWGATHPGIGFGPYNSPEENIIQIPVENLTCRPCTIYGKGECRRGDFACMNLIAPARVFERMKSILE